MTNKPTLTSPTPTQQPIRIPQPAVAAQPQQQARAAGWKTQQNVGRNLK